MGEMQEKQMMPKTGEAPPAKKAEQLKADLMERHDFMELQQEQVVPDLLYIRHHGAGLGVVPLGTIIDWSPGSSTMPIPKGWEDCDGGVVHTRHSVMRGMTK